MIYYNEQLNFNIQITGPNNFNENIMLCLENSILSKKNLNDEINNIHRYTTFFRIIGIKKILLKTDYPKEYITDITNNSFYNLKKIMFNKNFYKHLSINSFTNLPKNFSIIYYNDEDCTEINDEIICKINKYQLPIIEIKTVNEIGIKYINNELIIDILYQILLDKNKLYLSEIKSFIEKNKITNKNKQIIYEIKKMLDFINYNSNITLNTSDCVYNNIKKCYGPEEFKIKIDNRLNKLNTYLEKLLNLDDDDLDIETNMSTKYFQTHITMSNWISELASGSCIGIAVNIDINNGFVLIKKPIIFMSISDGLEFLSKNDKLTSVNESVIINDEINGKINSVLPIFINNEHWSISRLYMKPISNMINFCHPFIKNPSYWKVYFTLFSDYIHLLYYDYISDMDIVILYSYWKTLLVFSSELNLNHNKIGESIYDYKYFDSYYCLIGQFLCNLNTDESYFHKILYNFIKKIAYISWKSSKKKIHICNISENDRNDYNIYMFPFFKYLCSIIYFYNFRIYKDKIFDEMKIIHKNYGLVTEYTMEFTKKYLNEYHKIDDPIEYINNFIKKSYFNFEINNFMYTNGLNDILKENNINIIYNNENLDMFGKKIKNLVTSKN